MLKLLPNKMPLKRTSSSNHIYFICSNLLYVILFAAKAALQLLLVIHDLHSNLLKKKKACVSFTTYQWFSYFCLQSFLMSPFRLSSSGVSLPSLFKSLLYFNTFQRCKQSLDFWDWQTALPSNPRISVIYNFVSGQATPTPQSCLCYWKGPMFFSLLLRSHQGRSKWIPRFLSCSLIMLITS